MGDFEVGYAAAIADVVAFIKSDVRRRNRDLARAVKEHRLNQAHGEGECRDRIASTLWDVSEQVKRGVAKGARTMSRSRASG